MAEEIQRAAHAVSIDVEQNSRGVTFSVTCRGDDDDEVLARVDRLMSRLRERYGPKEDGADGR